MISDWIAANHWPRVAVMPTLLSLAALEAVVTNTSSAASEDKFDIITTLKVFIATIWLLAIYS